LNKGEWWATIFTHPTLNGQLSGLLHLPESTELSGKTVYLQALLDYEGKPFVSRLTQVRFE